MKQIDDWRLNGQEEYLYGAQIKKIVFPEFWDISKKEKNGFYRFIWDYAIRFEELRNSGEEYFTDDLFHKFWHEHCEFCWDKFMTDIPAIAYCTPDYRYWICEECYNDFKDDFHFILIDDTKDSYTQ